MGPQMTYAQLDQQLKLYQRKYRRKWFRADYMAYWKRVKHGIELRAGWRCTSPHFHFGERVLLLYPDGRVTVSCNIASPFERRRVNHYWPLSNKWVFWWWRGALMISRIQEKQPIQPVFDDKAIVIKPRFYTFKDKKGNNRIRSRYIEFDKNGEPIKPLRGMRFKTYKKLRWKEENKQQAPRKRGWYWTRRARNLYRNTASCKALDSTVPWDQRISCAADMQRWQRQPPQAYACGCVTYRKTYKKFSKKVADILAEPNATVRSAWMQIYGIQKFFQDAGSDTIDTRGQYKLLRLDTGIQESQEARRLIALKMTCPSTGTIYINSVPNNITNVSQALDWIYDYRGYLDKIGQQT